MAFNYYIDLEDIERKAYYYLNGNEEKKYITKEEPIHIGIEADQNINPIAFTFIKLPDILNGSTCIVQLEASDKQRNTQNLNLVSFGDSKEITINWCPNKNLTHKKGLVKFAFQFYKINNNEYDFILNTAPIYGFVHEGLNIIEDVSSDPSPSDLEDLYAKYNELIFDGNLDDIDSIEDIKHWLSLEEYSSNKLPSGLIYKWENLEEEVILIEPFKSVDEERALYPIVTEANNGQKIIKFYYTDDKTLYEKEQAKDGNGIAFLINNCEVGIPEQNTGFYHIVGYNPQLHLYTYSKGLKIDSDVIHGAIWNDYAEYREGTDIFEAGRTVKENGNDTLSLCTERLEPGSSIVSDTFGFIIGKSDINGVPIAVSGRALAYPYEDRNSYKPGDAVCSGPNGTVSKMTREEIREYPERIIGTVSAVPDYESWGTGNVKIDGRIWIKIR